MELGQIRAGLGPISVKDLQIEKEHIGPKEPVILVDYDSQGPI